MIPTPTFHTERLVFTATNGDKEDQDNIRSLYADPVTQALAMRSPPLPMSQKEIEDHLKWQSEGLISVNICLQKSPEEPTVAGPVIGFMYLGGGPPKFAHHRKAEFGISFNSAYTNKGYGTEALKWLLEQAFKRFNFHRVEGGTPAWNVPARACYKKVYALNVWSDGGRRLRGFTEEGISREDSWVEGRWEDSVSLGILASEWWATQEGGQTKQ